MSDVEASRPVNVALIGSGRMGAYHGATLAQRLPGTRLAAIADPAPGAAKKLASALGASSSYTDAAEAFADPAVDAVVIAAPARFHADLVVAAAEAGKGVFCEKPMGLQLAEVDRAIDAASVNGYATLTPGWPDDPTTPGSRPTPRGDQPNSSRNPSRHDGYSRVSPNSALALALLAARSWVP